MELIISNADSKPIYEQICTQIKNAILSGQLSAGEALPSTRAYEELEREGFIDRVPGKGCYVAEKNLELVREVHLRQIEAHMSEIITLAAGCSLSEEDVVKMLHLLWNTAGKDDIC